MMHLAFKAMKFVSSSVDVFML